MNQLLDENKTIIGLKYKYHRQWRRHSWDENKTIIGLKFVYYFREVLKILDENKTIIGLKSNNISHVLLLTHQMKIRL